MMLRKISDILRRYAFTVADDGPRVADRNKTNIEGDPIPNDEPQDPMKDVFDKDPMGKPGAPMKPGTPEEAPKPTAGPVQRAPRRKPAHARKWNPDTRRQNMREYMQEYRGTGKINQRNTQTRGA